MQQTGELIVTEKGTAEIELKAYPTSVQVFFEDEIIIVPCNPHHHDHLHWHIKNKHHHHKHDHRNDHSKHEDHFLLIISWHVQNIRIIKWNVLY